MNDIAVYIFIAFLTSGILYFKVDKLLGSIFLLGTGIGMMATTTGNDTWVGLLVLMAGIVLAITSPFGGKKKGKRH